MFYVFGLNEKGLSLTKQQKHAEKYKGASLNILNKIHNSSYGLCIYSQNTNLYLNEHELIKNFVDFIKYAKKNPQMQFQISSDIFNAILHYNRLDDSLIELIKSNKNLVIPFEINKIINPKEKRVFLYFSDDFNHISEATVLSYFEPFFKKIIESSESYVLVHNNSCRFIFEYFSKKYNYNFINFEINKFESKTKEESYTNNWIDIVEFCEYFVFHISSKTSSNIDNIKLNIYNSKNLTNLKEYLYDIKQCRIERI